MRERNLAHDLLDVDAFHALGAIRLLGRQTLPPIGPAPIRAAAPAVEMPAAPLIVLHHHVLSTF
jgi:hypothetical protein